MTGSATIARMTIRAYLEATATRSSPTAPASALAPACARRVGDH